MDVICSTSSIFNLVAISIDRFIAITRPIKYKRHKMNKKRGFITIALVWVISATIGFPIVLGLNTAPDKNPLLCVFYNTDFIIYSSLSSFYIPCIIMVYLYYCIFRTLYLAVAAKKKPNVGSIKPGSVIANKAQTGKLQETSLLTVAEQQNQSLITPETSVTMVDPPTDNPTESGSQEDEEEEEEEEEEQQGTPASEECQVIPNDKSTEFILTPVGEGSSPKEAPCAPAAPSGDKHCNNDSSLDETTTRTHKISSSAQICNQQPLLVLQESTTAHVLPLEASPKQSIEQVSAAKRNGRATTVSEHSPSGRHKKEGKGKSKSVMESGFCWGRRLRKGERKITFKKKEKSSAKKERKATQTLAIVLGVFLICWVPFFTCNIMDALCTKLLLPSCQPSITTFLLTTWLGYMNSFINPVIYTIFNPEFRKAFKKILTGG
uniref:G-protein coupled receptors family 1 profile domain-containing protein n=1 Tax=Strigamia maritima TaxID=126957 RepID=T1IYM6_STRMM